jgi:hypothetical protein
MYIVLSAFSRIFNQSMSLPFDFGDVQRSLGMFARALPKSIFCLVCGGSFVMAKCCFSESLTLGKCDDFLGCSLLLHACSYAVCRKDCTSRDTVAQGKALANLI